MGLRLFIYQFPCIFVGHFRCCPSFPMTLEFTTASCKEWNLQDIANRAFPKHKLEIGLCKILKWIFRHLENSRQDDLNCLAGCALFSSILRIYHGHPYEVGETDHQLTAGGPERNAKCRHRDQCPHPFLVKSDGAEPWRQQLILEAAKMLQLERYLHHYNLRDDDFTYF